MELKNVLIVNSDALEASALARAFEAQRMPTFVYATGQEAVTAVRNMKLALAIGSITLPGENILEVFRSLKSVPGHQDLPCMLILPKGAEYSPEDVLSYGIVDAIVRPVNVQEAVLKAMAHISADETIQESHVGRAVEAVLSEPPERRPRPVEDKESDTQLNLLDKMTVFGDDPDSADQDTGPVEGSPPVSPRFHREGQVFDDPVDKLNADLKRSIQGARRNRMLMIGATVLFFGGLAVMLFTGGEPDPDVGSVTEVKESVPVPAAPADTPAQEPEAGDSIHEDPFKDILKEELARRETKSKAVSTGPGKTVTSGGYFSVQVGAFGSESNAIRARDTLARKGYEAAIVPMVSSSGRTLHRVLVGRFPDREGAGEERLRLAEKENMEGFVTRVEH